MRKGISYACFLVLLACSGDSTTEKSDYHIADAEEKEIKAIADTILTNNAEILIGMIDTSWSFEKSYSNKELGIAEGGKYFVSSPVTNDLYVVYEDPEFLLVKYSF